MPYKLTEPHESTEHENEDAALSALNQAIRIAIARIEIGRRDQQEIELRAEGIYKERFLSVTNTGTLRIHVTITLE